VASAVLALYAISFAYVVYDQTEITKEFPTSTRFEIAAIIAYRATVSVVATILYIPVSTIYYLFAGMWKAGGVVVVEFGNLPEILKWIANNRIVAYLREAMYNIAVFIWSYIEPVWTQTVKGVVYAVAILLVSSPVIAVIMTCLNLGIVKKRILSLYQGDITKTD
jgi:hypothetical protein